MRDKKYTTKEENIGQDSRVKELWSLDRYNLIYFGYVCIYSVFNVFKVVRLIIICIK